MLKAELSSQEMPSAWELLSHYSACARTDDLGWLVCRDTKLWNLIPRVDGGIVSYVHLIYKNCVHSFLLLCSFKFSKFIVCMYILYI